MTQILAFAGNKQSGKTSGAHFVSAYIITQMARANPDEALPKIFHQDDNGKIIVPIQYATNDGNKEEGGILDFSRRDSLFATYAETMIWPYVKIYSFAETLKRVCTDIFNIDHNLIYGTKAQKEMPTQFLWDDLPAEVSLGNTGFLSGREFMQVFGTDICRKIYDNIWIDATLKQIETDQPDIAIIDDCRFLNEVSAIKAKNGIVIRLLRSVDQDNHNSEKELREASTDNFDKVIDNTECSITEKNQMILDYLYKLQWFTHHIDWNA